MAFAVFCGQNVQAAPGFTYSGRILDSSDQPVTSNDVYFTSTIYDEDTRCWLYTETRRLDLSSSSGTFAFNIGSNDADLVASSNSFNGSAATISDVFDNKKTITGLAGCSSGANTYTGSTSTANRVLSVSFKIGAGGIDQAIPALKINAVPSALQAYAVNGYGSEHLLKVTPAAIAASAVANNALDQTQYEEFWKLILGTSTTYIKTGSSSFNGSSVASQTLAFATTGVTTPAWDTNTGAGTHTLRIPMASTAAVTAGLLSKAEYDVLNGKQSASLASTKLWIGNGSGIAEAQSFSGDIASITNAGVVTATKTTTGESSKLLATDGSGVTSLKGLNLLGTTSGSLSLTSAATTANYSLKFPAAAPAAGQSLSADASGNFSWITPVTVNGSGNVGIGTTNPGDTLEVNGSVRVNSYLTTWGFSPTAYTTTSASLSQPDAYGIQITNTASADGTIGLFGVAARNTAGTTQRAYMGAVSNNAGTTPAIVFGQQTGATAYAERIRITAAGNVGINTSTPSKTLSVNGDFESDTVSSNSLSTGAINAASLTLASSQSNWVNAGVRNNAADGYSGVAFLDNTGAVKGAVGFGNPTSANFAGNMFLTSSVPGVPIAFGIQNVEAMRIHSDGKVGIGNVLPGYKLDVTGNINASADLRVGGVQVCISTGCVSPSDRNLKTNIKTLDSSLAKILKLRGVSYDWKDKEKYGSSNQVGVIAQELEEVYPSLVSTDKETGRKAVSYGQLVAPLIESTKELYGMCQAIEKNSERRLASLEKENVKIKQENAMIKAYLCGKDPKAPFCK
jgi:hypothetical protein